MSANFRGSVRSLVSRTAIVSVFVSGCGTQEPSPATPGPAAPPSAPANTGTSARPAPSPAQDLKDIKRDLQDVKKAVTPPVIIKPDAPTASAAAPGKAG
jgi:hypothetical protein